MIKRFLSSVIIWDSQQYNLELITMVGLVFRIKWWNGGWGTWKTVSLT